MVRAHPRAARAQRWALPVGGCGQGGDLRNGCYTLVGRCPRQTGGLGYEPRLHILVAKP